MRETVNAAPTKEFFIRMLTRDIELRRAIIDLVDNSVDGARRLRGDASLQGLWVKIEADEKRFVIADNCGGIPEDVARNYAFCFGRPAGTPFVPRSVGRFGVGMKRAVFKLGRHCVVHSVHADFGFDVEIDVDAWGSDPENWRFDLTSTEEPPRGRKLPEPRGTRIEVTRLHETVAEDFGLQDDLRRDLCDGIAAAHVHSIQRGLRIRVNGTRVTPQPLALKQSQAIRPAFRELPLAGGVRVRLYAGVAEAPEPRRTPSVAGWYIFCNDRLVLGADRSAVTGWVGGGEDPPRYHAQYSRFRGYALFDSDDPDLLPWTTTKTGIDEDSARYKTTRLEMMDMMQPVLDFLDDVKAEREAAEEMELRPLGRALRDAPLKPLGALTKRPAFEAKVPAPPAPPGVPMGHISYRKPKADIAVVQKRLGVRTNREVGERTFEEYFRRRCLD